MRVAVMGAGAVGGYFGARMAASGMDVTFIARGEHLKAMQKHGLRIRSIQEDLEIHAPFISSPDQVAPVDLVLLAVKSHDTEEAARSLAPFMGRETAVLSLQNGVDNADKVARLWGGDRSLAGVAYIAARISAPGVIEHSGGGRIVLGSLHAGAQDLEAGKALEHEALNGAVVRILQQSGKRAPINEILYSALSHLDRDLRAKQSGEGAEEDRA